MYKSKKQNYPGLYGKFKRIDSSNFEDEQLKHKRPDYTEDDNFENLDNLISSLREKSKQYTEPDPFDDVPEEITVKHVKKAVEPDDEEELEQLKKTKSIFDTMHVKNKHNGKHKDPEDEKFSKLITDSDFLDNLEDDLMSVIDHKSSKANFTEIHKNVNALIMKLNSLDSKQREQLAEKEFFIKLAKVISTIREQ